MADKEDVDTKFACNECRRRRIKCSRQLPVCDVCAKYNRHCLYKRERKTPLTRKHLTELEGENLVLKKVLSSHIPQFDITETLRKLKNGVDINDTDIKLPEPQIVDHVVGAKIHTASQYWQYQIPQLLPTTIDPGYQPKQKQTEVSPGSNQWDERKQGEFEPTIIDGMATTQSNSYLGAASSAALINLVGGGFFLYEKQSSPSVSNSSVTSESKVFSKSKLEYLVTQYFDAYHVSYPIIHKPTFLAQFNEVILPPPGWEGLLYIVAAIGSFMSATSPEENDDLRLFEMAKSKLSIEILETGNLTLVQTLTLISNYLQKRDRPNSGYNYLGLAVRMAMGLGLHKQSTEESLLNREIRNRVWWCLYIFDCGQTITYGRPLGIPCAGIDARIPLNILDAELTAMTQRLPDEQQEPTVYTSVKLQSLFHLLTNSIYERIITEPFPSSAELLQWDEAYIQRWKSQVPDYFKDGAVVPLKFKLAHSVLGWRYRNLRIVMYRTFLLKNLMFNDQSIEGNYDSRAGEICLQECSQTIRNMEEFWNCKMSFNRMDSWYSLYFLIPAVLMPLVCLRSNPISPNSELWRNDVNTAISIIKKIVVICPPADRILSLIDSLGSGYLSHEETEAIETITDSPFSQLMQLHNMLWPDTFDVEQRF